MKAVLRVMCLMGIGFGMRAIRCMSHKIALSWMEALDVLRMAGLILSLPSGVGNPKIAACPGIIPFCLCFPAEIFKERKIFDIIFILVWFC